MAAAARGGYLSNYDYEDALLRSLRAVMPPGPQEYGGSGYAGAIDAMGWTTFLSGICPALDSGEVTTADTWETWRADAQSPG